MSTKDTDHRHEFLCHSNPFAVNIVIHGIASAIGDDKYRTIRSSSSPATQILKIADFDEALRSWHIYFNRMSADEKESPLSWSALVMYHFSAVLLRNNISDIQMAAGSAFSFGRSVSAQRAQDAYKRLATTEPIGHNTYMHGVAIVSLCVQEIKETDLDGSLSPSQPSWKTYCAFLGILILWARVISVESVGRMRANSMSCFLQSSSAIQAEITQYSLSGDASTAGDALKNLLDHEMNYSDYDTCDILSMKEDIRQLIDTIRDRLMDSSWHICRSFPLFLLKSVLGNPSLTHWNSC